MIKLSLTFVFLCSISVCYGQYRHVLIKDTTTYTNHHFSFIKIGKQPAFKVYDYVLDFGYLDSSRMDTRGLYAAKQDSVWVYYYKPTIQLLTLNELLAKYHVASKYYNLPAYIDSVMIFHRENARFQVSAVASVKVKKDKDTKGKYINIRSVHHSDNPIADYYMVVPRLQRNQN